jgi:hypothetical protein
LGVHYLFLSVRVLITSKVHGLMIIKHYLHKQIPAWYEIYAYIKNNNG